MSYSVRCVLIELLSCLHHSPPTERRDSDVARSMQQMDGGTDGSRMRSDSDLARQMQEEWNADDIPRLETDDSNPQCSPTRKVTRHRSDRYFSAEP